MSSVACHSIISEQAYKDAKSVLQEIAQDKRGITPRYAVLSEWGLDHAKNFNIGVFLGEELVGSGEGVSKQEAQQKLELERTVDHRVPLARGQVFKTCRGTLFLHGI